jgi:NADPH:quinone reductase-like Zn-dependent oxidoreductase
MKAFALQRESNDPSAHFVWQRCTLPEPGKPGAGRVKVRMRAASLNFRDLMVSRGQYGPTQTGLVPLSDGAGEVVEVGEGVTRVKVGDRVAPTFHPSWIAGPLRAEYDISGLGGIHLDGVLREYVALGEHELVKLPEHLSFEQGATLPCAAVTAWVSLTEQVPLQPGQTVLVQGSGGVSVFALQFAKLFGARVIALSSSPRKLEQLRALGADELIDYTQTPQWKDRVLELTGGVGCDVVVEVGGATTFPQAVGATRVGGHVSVVGLLTGMPEVGSEFFLRAQTVQGIRVGSRLHFEQMNQAIAQHRLEPVVDKVFGFDEAPAALAHLAGQGHFGKVVVRI